MSKGVILYGPPASGKDTIDAELRQLSSRYRHYARLKIGPGRTEGYRITTEAELEAMRERGHVIWENRRYGAAYVIDIPALKAALTESVPIVHLGQPEAVTAIRDATPDTQWTVVALTTPRHVAAERLTQRDPRDVEQRLAVWDDTPRCPTPIFASIRVTSRPLRPRARSTTPSRRHPPFARATRNSQDLWIGVSCDLPF